MTRKLYVASAFAVVFAGLGSMDSVTGQVRQRRSTDNVDLIVDGRVHNVFRGDGSGSGEHLVQILVQRSEVARLDDRIGNMRFPAPGEYVYAHVSVSENPLGRASRRSNPPLLPARQTYIRVFLSSGERGQWEVSEQGWSEQTPASDGSRTSDAPIGNDITLGGAPGRSLGIASERVSLGLRSALKVILVEPDSPAAKAGIEPGDILVKANGASIASPDQLAAALRKSEGTLTLTVRDVRSGRDVAVAVELETARPSRKPNIAATPGRSRNTKRLGVVTELAFYGGEAAVKVAKVEPDSPAKRAGVVPGLLILKVNGKQILHPNDLAEAERSTTGTLQLDVVDPSTRRERRVQIDLDASEDIFR